MVFVKMKLISEELDISYFDEIKRIDLNSFEFPWEEKTIRTCLTSQYIIKFAAVHETKSKSLHGFVFAIPEVEKLHIVKLAVDSSQQRKGLGTMLMKAMEEFWRNNFGKELVLEVRSKNLKAIKFYLKYGFKIIERIPQFYSDNNDDALRMLFLF
ncbi:MAG: ribosomal protein S18-alanine N-acetyltransferase [Candidatus Riflebacteria bacterium]|nr:ribosomal protein S18-alanine N-acetyltransferase [Candidatus Riflebacteria bacterium]